MRCDCVGREEHAVGDLTVGQAAGGEDNDLALLRGEAVEAARLASWSLHGYAAGAQLCFRAAGPRHGPKLAERLQRGPKRVLGVVYPPLPSQPLPVVELELSPLERP